MRAANDLEIEDNRRKAVTEDEAILVVKGAIGRRMSDSAMLQLSRRFNYSMTTWRLLFSMK